MSDAFNLFVRGASDAVCRKGAAKICLCTPILILCMVIFNIYHYSPLFQLKRLYVPGLDKSLNSSANSTVAFDIYLQNNAMYSNAYFDPLNVTFYDGPNLNHSIASFTIPDFFLEDDGKVDYTGMVNATGLDLDAARQEVAANGFKVFRMNLITSVRYDLYAFWKTGRHAYKKSVDVKIGDTGAAAKSVNTFVGVKVMVLMVVVFLCSY